jgi:hypothetical protein
MQQVAGHRDRILGRCGELVPIVQFYNGVLKKDRQAESPEQRLPVLRGLADPAYPRVGSLHTQMSGATMDIAEIDVGQHIRIRSTYVALSVKTLNGLYLSGFDVSHHDEPTVKAFYEFRRQRDRQIQIQGRNQISVPKEPDSELKHGDDTQNCAQPNPKHIKNSVQRLQIRPYHHDHTR